MKLKDLIKDLSVIKSNVRMDLEISAVCYDSRTVTDGAMFVAVCGFESDGHKYIPNAIRAGASVILCEEIGNGDFPYVQVADTRKALAFVSAAFFGYPAKAMTMIGITGTSGKTTTSHLVKHMLEEGLQTKVGMIGTNGNMIGDLLLHTEHTTPESYELQKLFSEMREAGCTHVVMEVSSHALSLDRVAGIAYHTGVYTNLALEHLDFHKTMDEYAAAKKKLFSMCECGCVNLDDERAGFMMQGEKCSFVTTSLKNREADLFADDISLSPHGVTFTAHYQGQKQNIFLAIPGLFSVYNALSAISACLTVGMSLSQCAETLATAKGVKGRVESVPTRENYSVIIDYCHKPDSMVKVLSTLREVTKGRLICLFGCGGDRDRTKRPVMGKAAADYSDLVIVTSDNPRTEEPQAIINEILPGLEGSDTPVVTICDRVEAIHWALDNAREGDLILLAGKGHEDYQIIGHTKHHMDEREIVLDYLKEKKAK